MFILYSIFTYFNNFNNPRWPPKYLKLTLITVNLCNLGTKKHEYDAFNFKLCFECICIKEIPQYEYKNPFRDEGAVQNGRYGGSK